MLVFVRFGNTQEINEPPPPDYSCFVSAEGDNLVLDMPRCAVDYNGNGMIDDCSELPICEGGFLCPVDRNDSLCTAGDVGKPKKVCGNLSVFKSRSPMNFYDYQGWLRRYNLRCAGSDVLSCVGYQGDSFWKCGDTHGCRCPQGMTYNEQTRKCEASPQCPPNYVLDNGICKARKALDAAGREWDLSICRAIENTGVIVDGKEKIWCTVYPWQQKQNESSYSLCDFTGNVWFRWYVDDDPLVDVYRCKSDRYVANCVGWKEKCSDTDCATVCSRWDFQYQGSYCRLPECVSCVKRKCSRDEDNYVCSCLVCGDEYRAPSTDCWLRYVTTGWTDGPTPSSGSGSFYSRGYFRISARDETGGSPTYLEVKIELYKPLDTEPTYCPYEGSYYVPEKKICEASANCPAKYAVGVDALERCRQCITNTSGGLGINLPPVDEGGGNSSPPPPATQSCLRFFTGHVRECRAGGVNTKGASCCGISGWFKGECKNEEKALKKMREAGLCVYVGKYCSNKVLGQCLEEKRSYCCFNSKFAKVLQTCGRSQLGIGWGSGKSPNCRGFTVEEFASIDFTSPNCLRAIEEWALEHASKLGDRITDQLMYKAVDGVQNWLNSAVNLRVNDGGK